MYKKLDRVIADDSFDAVHADQLWMAPYALSCDGLGRRVLDQHNAVFQVPQQLSKYARNPLTRILLQRESAKLYSFEQEACGSFSRVVWVTEEDKRAAISAPAECSEKHCVIPIATDPAERIPVHRGKPHRVTMLGGMHWPPNSEGICWFAESIWPRIAKKVPGSVLTIIGKNPPARLLRALSDSQIEIAGYVSDLQALLAETAAFIVPLRTGAGMRVKILDAWCWSIPVVSTSVGAQGIRAVPGENLLLADDEGSFAECVIQILKNTRLAHRLAESGRATVESFYDWRKAYKAWDRVYN
jgi:glycosyltransferase involved in cell wall biosynthesis